MTAKRKLSKREWILVALTGALTLLGVVKFLLLDPWKKHSRLQQQLVVTREDLARERLLWTQENAARAPSSTAAGDEAQKLISQNAQFAFLIRDLIEQSAISGFQIQRLETVSIESGGDYDKILYSMDVEASYRSLGRFIEQLETSKMMIEIKSIEITRRAEDDLRGTVGRLKIYNYVVKN
jgi:hypothetical protein